MNSPQQLGAWRWAPRGVAEPIASPLERNLLWIVDASLFATICIAPFVFGGRHDLGRLIFSTLVALTAIAWLVRQCLLPKPIWTRTVAHSVLLLAAGLVILQLIPLPKAVIDWLAPRTSELLPLWTPGAAQINLGAWRTLTFTPHETTLSLSMLLSYGLLFFVVVQRVQSATDVARLLKWVALSAALMAGFGLIQFFMSNGKFFWFYEHPFRATGGSAQGSFANRNHFANFLVLGLGPLVAWLISAATRSTNRGRSRRTQGRPLRSDTLGLILANLLVVVAILLSLSRGGALALIASAMTMSVIYFRWGHVDVRHACGAIGLAVAILGVLSIYGYERVATRLGDLTDGSLQALDRHQARRKIWEANVAAFQEGWLTGAGAGSHSAIYPVYLAESPPMEYTHAENGYLQIATEMGAGGVALLLAGLGLCGCWCGACLSRLKSAPEQLWFGAVAAGLFASAVHSMVDFVWYIPACMSIAVILAACALRLAQLAAPEEHAMTWRRPLSRPQSIEFAAAGAFVGIWSVYTLFGPAMASIYWDRYLRTSVDKTRIATRQLSAFLDRQEPIDSSQAEPLLVSMIPHLEQAAYWAPANSRVHLRLASKYLARFELLQQGSENAMPLFQLREAALASRFNSPLELGEWLQRAVGENAEWLYRAYDHARSAVTHCPLQGEAYLLLADLCFLDGAPREASDAYANQGLRVRPYDADVLFEAGHQRLLAGDLDSVFKYWKQCFRDRGKHQLRIIHALAGPRIPAAVLIEEFQPDWSTLRYFWSRYRQFGQPQDLTDLLAYSAQVTKRQVQENGEIPPAYVWLCQANMYTEVERSTEALECLQQAYAAAPHWYEVRAALAKALLTAGRFSEAEPHVRWCLSRHPDNKYLKAQLLEINKQRFAQREQAAQAE